MKINYLEKLSKLVGVRTPIIFDKFSIMLTGIYAESDEQYIAIYSILPENTFVSASEIVELIETDEFKYIMSIFYGIRTIGKFNTDIKVIIESERMVGILKISLSDGIFDYALQMQSILSSSLISPSSNSAYKLFDQDYVAEQRTYDIGCIRSAEIRVIAYSVYAPYRKFNTMEAIELFKPKWANIQDALAPFHYIDFSKSTLGDESNDIFNQCITSTISIKNIDQNAQHICIFTIRPDTICGYPIYSMTRNYVEIGISPVSGDSTISINSEDFRYRVMSLYARYYSNPIYTISIEIPTELKYVMETNRVKIYIFNTIKVHPVELDMDGLEETDSLVTYTAMPNIVDLSYDGVRAETLLGVFMVYFNGGCNGDQVVDQLTRIEDQLTSIPKPVGVWLKLVPICCRWDEAQSYLTYALLTDHPVSRFTKWRINRYILRNE